MLLVYLFHDTQVGDRVGLKRQSNGSLIFYINGVEQGVAAANLPHQLYAVVDIYGQCSQVKLATPTQGIKYIRYEKLFLLRDHSSLSLFVTVLCVQVSCLVMYSISH